MKAARVSKILRFFNFPKKELGGYFFLEDDGFFEGFIYPLCPVGKIISRKDVSVNFVLNPSVLNPFHLFPLVI